MTKLLGYFKGMRIKGLLAPLLKMSEAGLELLVPLIIAQIIDLGISQNNRQIIYTRGLQLVITGLIGLSVSVTAQYFSAYTAVSFVKRIQHICYEKIQRMSFTQHNEIGTPTLITRLTGDMDSIRNGVNLTLRLLLRSPVVVIGACIMAFRVDKQAAAVFIGAVPLLALVIFAVMIITIPKNRHIRSAVDGALTTVRESVTGARVLRAFGIEKNQADEFTAKNEILTRLQERTGRISALLNPLTCLIVNTASACLIWIGAKRVDAGIISCGAVVALYSYMSQILVELIKLANLIITLTKSFACADRVASLLETPNEEIPESAPDKESGAYIEFDNVSFTYKGAGAPALKDISFSVNRGERIGIIGATGSGKSTLMNLLAGLYRPTRGHIYIEGKDINSYGREELAKKIGFVEQKSVIFGGTVRSNLTLGNEDAGDEEITAALKAAQADDFVAQKENGIDTVTEQNGRNFSGGQRQRLSVARALLKNPDILILDDASSALDYLTDSKMRKALSGLDCRAIFTVSQRTGSILDCDKIILLEDGEAAAGTHDELLKNNEEYREIHLSQFEEDDAV